MSADDMCTREPKLLLPHFCNFGINITSVQSVRRQKQSAER